MFVKKKYKLFFINAKIAEINMAYIKFVTSTSMLLFKKSFLYTEDLLFDFPFIFFLANTL